MSGVMEEEQFLPGTVRMYDKRADGTLNESSITLLPQPTDNKDDPLRWSTARKYWHATLVLFIAGLTAATSNDAGSASDSQNEELGISYNLINQAAGVLFIAIGYMTLLLYPTVTLYGRRLQYLICIALSIGGSAWFALVQTSGDSIGSQFFVGASESCAEALVQTSLSDIFFQHQRGTVLGLYVLSTNVGSYMGPLIAGYIADGPLGWRWIGWTAVIISSVTFVVFYFGLEETAFDRPRTDDEYLTKSLDLTPARSKEKKDRTQVTVTNIHLGELETISASKGNKPYFERIRLITPAPNLRGWGFKQYFQRLKHIFRVFTFPAVLFAGLQWGAQDAWLTFYLTLEEDNWYGSPWNYSDAADAIMNVPCAIGALIGCIYGGYFSDVFVKWMAKRRGGVAEAEDRLWLMFPAAIISPAGLILFGIGTNNGWAWPVPYVGLGFIGFGWGCAGDLSMAYLMDAYPDMVLEGMVAVAVINNTMGCIFTFATSSWLAAQSVTAVMCEIGALSCIFIMTSAPIMYWGKSFRRWTLPKYIEFIKVRDQM
ncbi:MFS multidrug transporter-like protein [Athelia psychrophila]|uniref:MFS multidrug transporter-like protein n=1 Tax=Athelia psychrophila TaxID=1759441 RepID=A0A166UGC1_9AGAM|nr:MFS multidrug transporter-like protein [Fibularhizoctonia sp. CBS 109695]